MMSEEELNIIDNIMSLEPPVEFSIGEDEIEELVTNKEVTMENPTSEINVVKCNPSPNTASKRKIEQLEKERDEEKIEREKEKKQRLMEKEELEQVKRELKELKQGQTTVKVNSDLPFGMSFSEYMTRDLKVATDYITKTIIPRVKRVVTENKESFKIFYELGDVCEPITPTSLKTCTLYNQGRQCREGNSHCDQRGNNRLHVCTVCWETLWVYAPHGIFACPLLTRKFWADQNIVRLL